VKGKTEKGDHQPVGFSGDDEVEEFAEGDRRSASDGFVPALWRSLHDARE
jgi:hypothetical protein